MKFTTLECTLENIAEISFSPLLNKFKYYILNAILKS